MWNIYDNIYDLTDFIKIHPGGEDIIKKTKGLPDITLLFETYHSFANRNKMIEMLEKYRVNKIKNSIMYNYNTGDVIKTEHHEISNVDYDYLLKLNRYENGNYNKLVNIIKNDFPTKFHTKASHQFILYNMFIIFAYILFLYYSMFGNYNIIQTIIYSFIAGVLLSIIHHNIMHNASHYALTSDPNLNYMIVKFINNFSLWNNTKYYNEHICVNNIYNNKNDIYYKISYDEKIININSPIINLNIPNFLSNNKNTKKYIEYIQLFFNNVLLSIKLPKIKDYDCYDIIIMLISYLININGGIIASTIYNTTFNLIYFYNDITFVINKYDENWLIDNVFNHQKYLENKDNHTIIYNNINYKIEHYLFPNICSEYYPQLSFIIKKFCYENKIDYSVESIISIYNTDELLNKYV